MRIGVRISRAAGAFGVISMYGADLIRLVTRAADGADLGRYGGGPMPWMEPGGIFHYLL